MLADSHCSTEVFVMQAMDAQQARQLLQASLAKPKLVTQVVPSPITFTWDATIQQIIQDQTLGQLIYVEVCGVAKRRKHTATWGHCIGLNG